jgi:tetratricopeptide (TPR) repeat protein
MRPQPGLATKPAPTPGLNRPQLSGRPTPLPGQVGGGGGLAGPPMTKPSFPTPGMPNRPGSGGDRPGLGSVQRPTPLPGQLPGGLAGNRPGAGGDRPGLGGGNRPGMGGNRPTTLPGDLGNRPGGGMNRPVTLPGDLANRPGGGGNRPGFGGNRPGIGGDRPGPLPGDLANRPDGGGNRPGFGGNRPGIGGDRPVTLPGDLANRPLNRPGSGNRPWGDGNRPWNGGNRPGIGGNRPGIGDGNNFWNSGNIGSGNLVQNNNNFSNVNVGAGWGLGGYGGGYGLGYGGGYGGWANHWNTGYVNPHYGGWYNGCWGGNWGYNGGWWAPFAVGAATWGLASTLGSWGWGYGGGGYVNPYYSAVPAAVVAASPYDYSQPVVVNNYVTSDETLTDSGTVQGGAATAEQAPAPSPSDAAFDAALSAFKQGDYAAALAGCDKAVKLAPNDSVIHEVRALSLFALGRYPEAAATLNAVLAVAPGMDWTTLSGLYGSVDAYTQQLRKLEDFCRANPDSAAGYFVLAYHYLVGGYSDMAADALRVVVAKQPGDVVAKRLLDALAPKEEKPADSPPAVEPKPTNAPAEAAQAGPETDLVGVWKATAGQDSFDLVITEDSQFTWKATPAGREPVAISGMIETARDAIALVSESAGTMAGKVTSKGADAFEFTLAGAPADAKPIAFQRQKP